MVLRTLSSGQNITGSLRVDFSLMWRVDKDNQPRCLPPGLLFFVAYKKVPEKGYLFVNP